jgi:hypothetical protein
MNFRTLCRVIQIQIPEQYQSEKWDPDTSQTGLDTQHCQRMFLSSPWSCESSFNVKGIFQQLVLIL